MTKHLKKVITKRLKLRKGFFKDRNDAPQSAYTYSATSV